MIAPPATSAVATASTGSATAVNAARATGTARARGRLGDGAASDARMVGCWATRSARRLHRRHGGLDRPIGQPALDLGEPPLHVGRHLAVQVVERRERHLAREGAGREGALFGG